MLALKLDRIKTAGDHVEHFEQVYPAGALDRSGDDYRVVGDATLTFDIHKDKQHFRLVGRVKSTLELTCGRCLDPFARPVDLEFDLRYQPHTPDGGEGEREIKEDDLTTAYYENDEIDLGQLMLEQFYLSLPMKPLCRDDCQGLCPVCGKNRNREMCACQQQWEDPRLAALRALKPTKRES